MSAEQMRSSVADSWQRSAAAGVSADRADAPITVPADSLSDARRAHPLSVVFPLLDDVLGQAARDCGALMAVSDADAQLLWVCGSPDVLRRAESIGFVEGSNWDERIAGTNAPGLALRLDRPATVIRSEHFRHSVRAWSCAAVPIHDPATSRILGVLDLTGGDQIVVPQTMAMVRAAARMAESELARDSATRAPTLGAPVGRAGLTLMSLGRNESLATIDDGRSPGVGAQLRLSPRHSEILLLLASAPRGLSGDELAVLLYTDDSSSSTLRAELNRLRNLLGEQLLASRPYRLTVEVSGDWLAVRSKLVAGDVRGALAGYVGPLLPRSTAPGVARLRESLAAELRAALLRSNESDLMSAWTRSGWGGDDYQMWQAQRAAIGASSPLLPLIDGQLDRLDRELGS